MSGEFETFARDGAAVYVAVYNGIRYANRVRSVSSDGRYLWCEVVNHRVDEPGRPRVYQFRRSVCRLVAGTRWHQVADGKAETAYVGFGLATLLDSAVVEADIPACDCFSCTHAR